MARHTCSSVRASSCYATAIETGVAQKQSFPICRVALAETSLTTWHDSTGGSMTRSALRTKFGEPETGGSSKRPREIVSLYRRQRPSSSLTLSTLAVQAPRFCQLEDGCYESVMIVGRARRTWDIISHGRSRRSANNDKADIPTVVRKCGNRVVSRSVSTWTNSTMVDGGRVSDLKMNRNLLALAWNYCWTRLLTGPRVLVEVVATGEGWGVRGNRACSVLAYAPLGV